MDDFRAHLALTKSPATANTYCKNLSLFSAYLAETGGDIENPTRADVQSWVNSMGGLSAATIHNRLHSVRAYADYIGKQMIASDIRVPERQQNKHIAPQSLDRKEQLALLRAVERDGNLRNIAIVYLLLYAGLRVSELCNLNRADVDISQRKGAVIVREGKGKKERKIPLAAECRHHLERYIALRDDSLEPMFLSNYRQRISPRSVEHMLGKYGIHPHQLRHTFCRRLVADGVDIPTVAELAGHADINVTRRYAAPNEAELSVAIEKALL